jgi:RNA polymerase sigma factor (sigma-70 family)
MGPNAPTAERLGFDQMATGGLGALAVLHDEYSSVVFAVAFRVTSDRAAAEDITQTVFLGLWRQPDRYDPARGSLRSWLATVAHHQAVDWLRLEESHRRRNRLHALEATVRAPDVEETVHAAMTAETVRVALAALPEHQRTPIRLAFLGGRTYRQVAEELGVAEGTIKSRIRFGLRHMANTMESRAAG